MNHFKLINPEPLNAASPQPWRLGAFSLADINPIGSMISEDESRFLHWATREYFRNEGAILDFGPLAGGSTFALAQGLADSGHPIAGPRIHSYDLWEFWEDWGRFFPGKTFAHLEDIQGAFLENLGPLARYVVPHKGNISLARWTGEPIELLFLDAAKTPRVMANLVENFFPHLIPGHSLVIHQDYVCAECPWIHAIQEHLAAHFELVDSPDGGSVCFRLRKAIPPGLLAPDFYETLPVAAAAGLLENASRHLRGWYRLCVLAAQAHLLAARGESSLAQDLLRAIETSPDYRPEVDYDLRLAQRALQP